MPAAVMLIGFSTLRTPGKIKLERSGHPRCGRRPGWQSWWLASLQSPILATLGVSFCSAVLRFKIAAVPMHAYGDTGGRVVMGAATTVTACAHSFPKTNGSAISKVLRRSAANTGRCRSCDERPLRPSRCALTVGNALGLTAAERQTRLRYSSIVTAAICWSA